MTGYEDKGWDVSMAVESWLEETGTKKKDLALWLGCSVDNLNPGRFAPSSPTPVAAIKRDSAINRLKIGLLARNIRHAASRHRIPAGTERRLADLREKVYRVLGEEPDDDLDPFEAARAGLAAFAAGNWQAGIPVLESVWNPLLQVADRDVPTAMRVASVLMDFHCYVGQPEHAYGLFKLARAVREPRTEEETLAVAEAWNTYGVSLRHLRAYRGNGSVSPESIVGAHDKVVKWCKQIGEPGRVLWQRALRDSAYALLWVFDDTRKPVALPDNAECVLDRLRAAQGMVGSAEPADGLHVEWLADVLTTVECASVLGRVVEAEAAWDAASRFSAIVRYASPEINVPLRSKMDMSEMPLLFAQGKLADLYGKLVAYRDEEAFREYADRQARVADAIARMDRGDVETVWWPFVR